MYLLTCEQGVLTFDEVREYEGEPAYLAIKHAATEFMVMARKLSEGEHVKDHKDVYHFIDTSKNTDKFWEPCILLYTLKSFEQADAIIASYRRAIKALYALREDTGDLFDQR